MSLMLAEIRQQPAALERTLRRERKAAEKLRRLLSNHRPRAVIFVARGTSDNAATFGRYLIEITTGIPVSLAAPSVTTLYQASIDYSGCVVVGISQSGESTDVNLVVEQAAARGAITVGITNHEDSTLARIATHVLPVRAGKEKSVAATKTYTGQLMAIYLLAWALGAPIDPSQLERIPEQADAALKLDTQAAELARRYVFMRNCAVVGRGFNYASAFEFALKLMETCYVVAERFSSADFLHGPIAIVEPIFPVFLFAAPGVTWPPMRALAERLSASSADLLLISDKSNREAAAAAGGSARLLEIPANLAAPAGLPADLFTPIPYIIPAQLVAAHLTAEKKLDPDQPRGLSKVTRTL